MVISANTLFHFTDSVHNLISILTVEFKPQLHLENFGPIFSNLDVPYEIAVPMVCFCDLPLSQAKDHIDFYGGYGIGMTKEWGIKNGLNPVMYLQVGSFLTRYFNKLLKSFLEKEDNDSASTTFREIISFSKLYEGKTSDKKGKLVSKKFYDEREWRYVPLFIHTPTVIDREKDYYLVKNEFENAEKRKSIDQKLHKKYSISFEPADIKYIIVKKEEERLSMIQAIERIKGRKYDSDTVKIISSKIISEKRIKDDF